LDFEQRAFFLFHDLDFSHLHDLVRGLPFTTVNKNCALGFSLHLNSGVGLGDGLLVGG
jgi:hypothetical protein